MSPQLKTETTGCLRLTPEQLKDLRMVLDNFGRHSITSDMTTAAERLADGLFPETEPTEDLRVHNHTPYRGFGPDGHCAERTENGRLRGQCMTDIAPTVGRCPKELEGDIESFPCVLSAGHRERHKSAGGLTWGHFTPAEPAEDARPEAQQLRDLSTALRAALGILDPLDGEGWSHAWRTADDLDDCADRMSPPVVALAEPFEETDANALGEIPRTSNGRGFHVYGDPVSTDYGAKIRVYESSAASGPHVWMSVTPGSVQPDKGGSVAAHMDATQTRAVIARLQAWLDEIPTRWHHTSTGG